MPLLNFLISHDLLIQFLQYLGIREPHSWVYPLNSWLRGTVAPAQRGRRRAWWPLQIEMLRFRQRSLHLEANGHRLHPITLIGLLFWVAGRTLKEASEPIECWAGLFGIIEEGKWKGFRRNFRRKKGKSFVRAMDRFGQRFSLISLWNTTVSAWFRRRTSSGPPFDESIYDSTGCIHQEVLSKDFLRCWGSVLVIEVVNRWISQRYELMRFHVLAVDQLGDFQKCISPERSSAMSSKPRVPGH
jgi:hypothetical protein